jgi:hypothetical protein
MWHHEMAMGITWELHGNIVQTSQEGHGSVMITTLEHGNIISKVAETWLEPFNM